MLAITITPTTHIGRKRTQWMLSSITTSATRTLKGIRSLPGTLREAIDCLKADEVICGCLGDHVLSQYVEGKEKEWDAYRTHVSKWEIDRYIVMY